MSTDDKMYVNVRMSLALVRRLDRFVAHLQQEKGPRRTIKRSDAIRLLLEEHLPVAPLSVRTRVRKPAS
jgi:hypothetical protein